MRRLAIALACLLSATAAARAQTPGGPAASIKAPATVAPGGWIVADASASTAPGGILWAILPEIPFRVLDSGGQTGVFMVAEDPPAGTYAVAAVALGGPGTNGMPVTATLGLAIVTVGAGPGQPAGPTGGGTGTVPQQVPLQQVPGRSARPR